MPVSATFWQARIAKTEELIVLYEDAVTALVVQGVESYTLDTGQTIQKVTRRDVDGLNNTIDRLMNRLVTLCARVDGSGTLIARSAT